MRAQLTNPGRIAWRAAAMRVALFCLGTISFGWTTLPSPAQADAFSVTQFSPWHGYAIPNGLWLTGDFFGTHRNGIVHVVDNSDYVNVWNSRGDGTFDVKPFRPWAGYAMPNGLWLTADLTGDGRTDIVHVVQGADYVNVWKSKGDGTFDVKPFRPWAGYAMPNGVWLTADLNGDGRTDLVHVVQGADYVNVWKSKGNGTFDVKPFRPWAGYAMPNGVWLTADLNGDGKTDLVHVVQGADYVNVWMSRGNGTFDVKPFRPWANYAMPNGIWLAGKFTGSHNTDMVHIVQGADYANVWRSKGDGTFEVKPFRPWPGYAMPNGIWLAGDFDRDGKTDLVHAVQGTDYVHIWRSRGDMTFNVTTFSPWKNYAIPNGIWLAEDWSGDGKMDIVHAVQGTDYVHPWRSTLPAPGEFSIEALEVTQSVQDMAHSVPLVADKGTVVRAYLDYNFAGSSGPISGTLRAIHLPFGGVQSVNPISPLTVNPAQNGQLSTKRNDASLSLTFRLPPAAETNGSVLFTLPTLTSGGGPVPCSDCATTSRVVSFSASGPVRARVIGLSYTTGTPPTSYSPRTLDFDLIQSWLGRAYPTASVQMTRVTVPATPAWPFDCNAANAQIAAIRALDVGGGTDARTHYFGLVADGGGFMRGCAAGIPTTPNPATVASGPTGSNTWGWDTDGSYGDWYTGHELGHTYGRFHIGSGCGESADDPNYPFPKGQLSKDDDAFVGFDLGDAGHGIAMAALPGPGWHDVMSYCVTQWLSSYTYGLIRDRLIAENGLPSHGPAPSAGAAIAGMAGPPLPEAVSLAPSPVTPSGTLPTSDPTPGTAPETMVTSRETPAPVRYGIADTSIAALRAAGSGVADLAALPTEGNTPLLHTIVAAGDLPAQPVAPTPPDQGTTLGVELQQGPLLHVVATINLTRGSGHITNINPVQQALVPRGVDTSRARLRFIGANGADLGERPVQVKLDSDLGPGDEQVGIVDAAVTAPPGTEAVVLVIDDKAVDQVQAGGPGDASAAREALRARQPNAEAVNASRQDGQLVIQWQPIAPGITYNVQVSTDNGASWHTVGANVPGNRLTLDAGQFSGAASIDVRVAATTGFESQMLGQRKVDIGGR